MKFDEQLARIMAKLEVAKARDPGLEIFGADSHRYAFNPPASRRDVGEFEEKTGVRLPEDYVAFLTTIGNGGPGHFGGAGPYHGVYRLGDFGFMPVDAASMSAPCVITSALSKEQWREMTDFDCQDPPPPDEDQRTLALFAGLMTIGTQGCSYQTMLALNGIDRGRVVFVDQDLAMPSLAKQRNFLDWYEAWLDRLAAGKVQ